MIVRRQNFKEVINKLTQKGIYALDTETTGLSPHLGDRLFSVIICDGTDSFYFNFHPYAGLAEEWWLPREWLADFKPVLENPETTWGMHNAKFDLAMLHYEGLQVLGSVHCTEVGARIEYNAHMNYKLDFCAKRIGLEKSKAVDQYIKEHKLYKERPVAESDEVEKDPQYIQVPFDIMVPYGEKDGFITHKLLMHQISKVQEFVRDTPSHYAQITDVYGYDLKLTKTVFQMELTGIRVDRDYCKTAFAHEQENYNKAAKKFSEQSGIEFKDSPKVFKQAFDAIGERYPTTAKGNPSFDKKVLGAMKSPLAQLIMDYRKSYKKAHTYYLNFLYYADPQGRIHPNLRIAGTVTHRLSCAEPNLQNLKKNEDDLSEEDTLEDSGQFQVRRAFVPCDPDTCLVMIDYKQMEYRLMLEYAGEMAVIEQVLAGVDVHDATAKMMAVTREPAKTLNFMLLYGGGVAKLAASLKKPMHEAKQMRNLYFATLPKVTEFTRNVIATAEQQGMIRGWNGFRYNFPDPNFAYKAPNHLIQGGCATVVRKAMVQCHDFIVRNKFKTRMLLQVHDELLFGVPRSEFHIVPELQKIMETAYPYKRLPLLCDVSHSWKSWADKVKGMPQ